MNGHDRDNLGSGVADNERVATEPIIQIQRLCLRPAYPLQTAVSACRTLDVSVFKDR